MRMQRTVDLALALYRLGVESNEEEILSYVSLIKDDKNYYWYSICDVSLQLKLGEVSMEKKDTPITVDDFYKVEHIIGILKRMVTNKKREDFLHGINC